MSLNNSVDVARTVSQLTAEVARLSAMLSPWVTAEEMRARYGVTGKTLTAMERRGEIPVRVRGRWLRSELVEWENLK